MDEARKGKTIKSAFDSPTFDTDVTILVERNVGSATISPSGRDVALASTDGLDIIDLDSPLNPPRHLRHGLPWLVADVQWSPFAARDYWVVSTANQKALVWNLNMQEETSQGAIEHTLHGHSRAITDINFSAHHPDMLASCAVDGFVHEWDLRRPRRPVLTFCDWFAGATQVKYNRQDSHILASSHDRWLRIWDDRKGSTPLRSINAHESKIYGVDWNRTRTTKIVTCSLDKSIKFWDYENDVDEPERIIRTDFPVWRARHTPFGWGVLAMPQDTPGNLHLYDRRLQEDDIKDGLSPSVATFPGHGNSKVKEFLWRSRGGVTDEGVDNREFQLVSWGDDNHLRLQHVDPQTLEGVGHVKGTGVLKKLSLTRQGAVYKTFRTLENCSEKKNPTISGPRPASSGLKVSALKVVGMKKMALPRNNRTHMMIRAPAISGKDKSLKHDDQNQNQIGWMSGIKFSKPEHRSASQLRPSSRRFSLLNPELTDEEDWNPPESLHDEIIRIHEQLPKITFDDVNMDTRTMVASMNGPWGENGNPIYTKVTVAFPDQYPESKAPTFTIGKTSLMSDEVYEKLKREVQQISAGSVARRRGCLEATLCYLLGEINLEASTTFLKDDTDDDLDALADESSSDDDDGDIPAGASAMMSQELDSSVDMLPPINRNANVPLPRFCGARFSATGKLVCFFPPKEDKVKSLLETLVAKNNARSRGEPSFETFGRLNNNTSPVPRIKAMSLASESKYDSDESDESEASSSSDSDSSHYRVARFPMSDYFRRSARRPWGRASPTMLSQRSSAGGTGTGTGTGTGLGRSRPSKPKNIIALHDISGLLPSKQVLAQGYAIFGDGPDVCEHNATVAEAHGFSDLADVWRYAALLLHNEIPLEVLDKFHHGEPVLVIARDAIKRQRSNSGSDSGVDISFDAQGRPNSLSGRVKWGHSPLAKQLICDLFAHFESLADVQMLAMLSCIFNEPVSNDAVSRSESQLTQPQTPISMKTPAFSLDYFPTDWSKYLKTPNHSAVSTPKIAHTPSGLYGSVGSSTGAWGSDPASVSYSCGETPPLRSSRASLEHLNHQTQSLSTSPDNPRGYRRVNSGIASSFAASFSRPFSTTASSSPPNPPPSRKRPSPVENLMSSIAPSVVTWGNTTVLGSVREQPNTGRSSLSDDEDAKDGLRLTVCTGISVSMENQHAFDDEGCITAGLLDPGRSSLYASYRRAYAELLYIWGHPLARLEILKFNGLKDLFSEMDSPDTKSFADSMLSNDTHTLNHPSPSISLGKKDHSHPLSPGLDHGLDVTGYCLKDECRLEPLSPSTGGGAIGRCEKCKSTQRQLRCIICLEPISALFPACLNCNCVTHQDCLLEYHSYGNTECPGGCDCDCGDKASIGLIESWGVLTSAIEQMRLLDAQRVGKEKELLHEWGGEEKSDWDTFGISGGGMGRGYSTFSKRFVGVRTGDWGIPNGKKASSLRNEELF
ncbi:putative RWD,RING finger and WD repeat-containing protein [Lachnellula cervina]|uniref:Putative RWD,RING finger and WD repeat-containing protein n=1 Tax=Lachnellula cervina TaxID=1316786 RepID=A0A7D8UKE8_9HELO|nr:putative RWD,RING finger and WD repeat-containing protein [Lachnellula cervina]